MIYRINKNDYLQSRNGLITHLNKADNLYDYFLGVLVFYYNKIKKNEILIINNDLNLNNNSNYDYYLKSAYEYCMSNCNYKDKSVYNFIYLSLISKSNNTNKSLTKI